jgi:hypothetical protein
MKYDKPEVTALGTAIASVKGTGKDVDMPHDGQFNPDVYETTISAYEADE